MRHKKAFTLVELLVVISIIAILVSVLLPALGKARKQAHAIVCLANLRSMGYALVMYAEDNDEYLPTATGQFNFSQTQTQTNTNQPILSQGKWIGQLTPYAEDELLYRCPGDNSPHFTTPRINNETSILAQRNSSYGLNFYLSESIGLDFNNRKAIKTGQHLTTIFVVELAEEGEYSVLDHVHPEGWYASYDKDKEMPYLNAAKQLAYQRHQGKSNYLFIDGHAEKLEFLKTYDVAWDRSSFGNIKYIANKYDPEKSK